MAIIPAEKREAHFKGFRQGGVMLLTEVEIELRSVKERSLPPMALKTIFNQINRIRGSAMAFGLEAMADFIRSMEDIALKLTETSDEDQFVGGSDLLLGAVQSLAGQVREAGKEPDAAAAATHTQLTSFLDELGGARPVITQEGIDRIVKEAGGSMEAEKRAPRLGGKHLLVIDDDPTIRELYLAVFTEEGARVEMAEDGRQALTLLEEGSFDLLLVDLNMPEMDGYELIRAIKADVRWKTIPLMVLTADSTRESVEKTAATGVSDYLVKSTDLDELVGRVKSFLAG